MRTHEGIAFPRKEMFAGDAWMLVGDEDEREDMMVLLF